MKLKRFSIFGFFLLLLAGISGSAAGAQLSLFGSLYREAKIVPQTFIPSSDGTLIAITEQGPKDGRTILFLHGFGYSGAVFYNQFSSVALLPFHIVTMDLRGHGFSDKPSDPNAYTDHGLYADDIHSVIEGLHLDKPVLAGWSFGTVAVFDYLQKYGDASLSGVDLIDPLACPDLGCTETVLTINRAVKAYADLISPQAAQNFSGAEEFITAVSAGAADKRQTLILRTILSETPSFVLSSIFGIHYLGYADVMASLKIPVLIQYGSNDPLIDLDSILTDQKLIRRSTTKVYAEAAHIPFILNADRFNLDLAEWIAAINR